MKAHYIYPLILASIALAPVAQADDLSDWLKIDGFGTVGAYKGNNANAGVRVDTKQSTYSQNEWRFDGDTQASIQATLNPHGKLKAVLQLISKKDINSSHKPTVEWAYVSYPITSEIDFKLGRTVAPIYLLSDYRNLAYAQTTVRPQSEVYQVNPISYQDGATARWERKIGSGMLQLEGFFGKANVSVALGEVDLDRVKGLSLKWSDGSWAVRGGFSKYNASLTAPTVAATIKSLTALPSVVCANCSTVIPSIASLSPITADISTLGVTYDDGTWIAQTEWTKRKSSSVVISSVSAWDVLGGYRYGDFTPYVGAGRYNTDQANPGLLPGPGAPAAFKAQLNYLNASYLGVGKGDRDVFTVGVRWDFAKNLALKAQLERIKMDSPEIGASSYVQYPTSMLGKPNGFDGRVSMFTLNLDFVF
ncbi:porin [Undibacterium flavidum]|uniref:Porin n=1 Tax=Undibacterium flavidum TaxID=2762297 RepID=A0ABR6Y767_9BURK|nr:porin [Undibacterium flavidum]MBC3872455.1 porin [Undibacterium flavidum]